MKFTPPHGRHTIPWEQSRVCPDRIVPGSAEHDAAHVRLFELAKAVESDFEPYGKRVRGGWDSSDCSCGCRHYAVLGGPLGHDWGVCMNKQSPRAGLLTFEHQGCPEFDQNVGEESEELSSPRRLPPLAEHATIKQGPNDESLWPSDLIELSKQSAYFTIILEEDLRSLEAGLGDDGFKVIPAHMLEDDDLKQQAHGSAILTKNSQAFVDDAVRYDYDVIGIEEVKDDGPEAVRRISGAIRRSHLPSRKGNFWLNIRNDGSFQLRQLI
jgi:hypothetical protein